MNELDRYVSLHILNMKGADMCFFMLENGSSISAIAFFKD
jgi:hypothetical protein